MSLVSVAVGFLVTTLILKTSSVGPTIVIVSVLVFIMSLLKKSAVQMILRSRHV